LNTDFTSYEPARAEAQSAPAAGPGVTNPATSAGWDALDLSPALTAAVRAAGYAEPSPIQLKAIPHVFAGRDVLGCAQTGTGKTAAFALPILDTLIAEDGRSGPHAIRALVLAPTRELAAQIGASFLKYAPKGSLRCHVVFGGVGKGPQVQALRRGLDVLVATPGRLLDLMNEGRVDLSRVETFVLDEADRMLDMGFLPDVRRVAAALPKRRQTLLFSATMPREIRVLAERLLVNPVEVAVDRIASTVAPLEQFVYFVEGPRKADLLLSLLQAGSIERALVFTRTKHGANRLAEKLTRARIQADAIHGNKSQPARERALASFKRGTTRVVVATDIAARGIDVKDLPHVVNFDIPHEPETYVHRVGRTGRAGASGTAVSLCGSNERSMLAAIERLTQKRLQKLEVPNGFGAAAHAARSEGAGYAREERRAEHRGEHQNRGEHRSEHRNAGPAGDSRGPSSRRRSRGGRGRRGGATRGATAGR
jgi:ATP-dependent RNA helicase RhlE